MQTYTTKSVAETQKLAAEIAKTKEALQVITLTGDLGSGKTTFIQGLAQSLGIAQRIISPTFIIMRTYNLPKGAGKKKFFYHIDLYRATNIDDVEALGLLEIIKDPQNIIAIEWPEKIAGHLPKNSLDLTLRYIADEMREIIIKGEQ